jgi:methylmalonyl-CoA/ethylmalonyl-CoA epimerase
LLKNRTLKNIDHIGIAVKNLDASEKLFQTFFGAEIYHKESVASQHLNVTFFKMGNTKVELLHPMSEQSGVHKFLETKGEGIHHVAFLVNDIHLEIERLKSEGFKPLTDQPFRGALNKLVIFFHPKTTGGVLIELCQKMEEETWDN